MIRTYNINFKGYDLVVTGDFEEGEGGIDLPFIPDKFKITKVLLEFSSSELDITDLLHEEIITEIEIELLS